MCVLYKLYTFCDFGGFVGVLFCMISNVFYDLYDLGDFDISKNFDDFYDVCDFHDFCGVYDLYEVDDFYGFYDCCVSMISYDFLLFR